jgi:uncharacterized membrane protein YhaH (DUF805 family)
MNWYIKALKNYAVFEGRSSRQEYWMFVLIYVLISFALDFIIGLLGATTTTNQTVLSSVFDLAMLVPNIAVGIRRMHDTNRSGWWQIVPIAGLIFAIEAGHPGENKYGRNPNEQKS